MGLSSSVTYAGLSLSAKIEDKPAVKDIMTIASILIRNQVCVGGYDGEEEIPSIEFDEKAETFNLYLGR